VRNVILISYGCLISLLLSCDESIDQPTIISGTAATVDGFLLKNQSISIEGIKEVICPPIGFCDEDKTISEHQTTTDLDGVFYVEVEPEDEVEYYDVVISGTIPGSNNCVSISQVVYSGKSTTDLELLISCE